MFRAKAALVVFKPLPVLNTSSPNKLFDAFASQLPVIQSTQGWIKELIENENCGLNVHPNNPIEFANAIQLLGTDYKLRDQLALNAKKVAKEYFDRSKLASKMLDVLNKVVNKNK